MLNRKLQISILKLCVSVALWLTLLSACSIPSLEEPQCTEARVHVQQFYSFHFGNDMTPSADNIKLREKFLTRNLAEQLASTDSRIDYFTASENFPKTFRVAECRIISPTTTGFDVVLFWKDDVTNTQREIKVDTLKENDKWLIDRVSTK